MLTEKKQIHSGSTNNRKKNMNNVNMEKEQINIAELLKDCPKGMELYSPMFGTVFFEGVRDTGRATLIDVTTSSNTSVQFYSDGKYNTYYTDSEVTLFPSKGKTWEGFVPPCEFKDGDILAYTSGIGTTIFIHRNKKGEHTYKTSFYAGVNSIGSLVTYNKDTFVALCGDRDTRLATEEEKSKLFQAIKANGYKWNPETKTLEKLITPKFKVGDVIMDKDSYKVTITDVYVEDEMYKYESVTTRTVIGSIDFDKQDEWELVPNKFNLNTLVPFESRVLVRGMKADIWRPAIWGCYFDKDDSYIALGGICWAYCIPYEGNEHLKGKTDDCDEYFKTWK